MKKCVAAIRRNVLGRFHPVKSVRVEKSAFWALVREKLVGAEMFGLKSTMAHSTAWTMIAHFVVFLGYE